MEEDINLWTEIGNYCLEKALGMLKQEDFLTESTVGMVKTLVETAIRIDELDFRWKTQA